MQETPITFDLKVNPKNHPRPPADEHEELVWAILDTAQAVLSQGAAMVTSAELREELKQRNPGVEIASDQDAFLKGLVSGGVTSYADLAPESEGGNLLLSGALFRFILQGREDADRAFRLIRGEFE